MTYIHNASYLEEIADSISPYRSTADLLDDLSLATDTELALAYDSCMSGEAGEVFPLYLVTNEMQARGLSFDQLEELLTHHYE